MLHRQPPTILSYGFGLALLLSLGFNGYLLLNQTYTLQPTTTPTVPNSQVWQNQLQACSRANQQKDSLIRTLTQVAPAPAPTTAQLPAHP